MLASQFVISVGRWAILIAAAGLSAGCGASPQETLTCTDLLPPGTASYGKVIKLVVDPNPKSCGTCHNTKTPIYGFNFEGPAVAYDALTNKMALVYPQVASGHMPKVGEPWTAGDLRLLRSWYCDGGFYDP